MWLISPEVVAFFLSLTVSPTNTHTIRVWKKSFLKSNQWTVVDLKIKFRDPKWISQVCVWPDIVSQDIVFRILLLPLNGHWHRPNIMAWTMLASFTMQNPHTMWFIIFRQSLAPLRHLSNRTQTKLPKQPDSSEPKIGDNHTKHLAMGV